MKQFQCYDCEHAFHASTREDVLNQLYAHYIECHYGVITGATMAEKKAWMEQFEADWAAAPELTE